MAVCILLRAYFSVIFLGCLPHSGLIPCLRNHTVKCPCRIYETSLIREGQESNQISVPMWNKEEVMKLRFHSFYELCSHDLPHLIQAKDTVF
jgi:hypothetical protein